MDKLKLLRIIDLVEKHFIEPNTVMTFADWIRIREKVDKER